MDFLNVNVNFAFRALLNLRLELFDLRSAPPDDNTGAGCSNRDANLIAGPVNFDRADSRGLEPRPQRSLQPHVFAQQLHVTLLGEPTGIPGLRVAQPESVRMYFLTHSASV